MIYDFREDSSFEWTPLDEGVYTLIVRARDRLTGEITAGAMRFGIEPRVRTQSIVTATAHPLVALYSAPACAEGLRMIVMFRHTGEGQRTSTSPRPCRVGQTMNIYLAGMQSDSTYGVQHVLVDETGAPVATGPELSFRTARPAIRLPVSTVLRAPGAQSSYADPITLQSVGKRVGIPHIPFASDMTGKVLWYYNVNNAQIMRPVDGGTLLLLAPDPDGIHRILREIDVAGNVVRETNWLALNYQLEALGLDPITDLHHEAIRLANGHTLILASLFRMVEGEEGEPPHAFLGDVILDLDENWQIVWSWNGFDHLDTSRLPTLDERCGEHRNPHVCPDPEAYDWLHSNTIAYVPEDGSLLITVRNQDWVLKLDYQDGAGAGEVLWRLGPEGDFAIQSDDPYPWFTHPHDTHFEGDQLITYDNGSTRCVETDVCYSRGQLYNIDESTMTVSLALNADLQNFSRAFGAAQKLANGNFHFTSGYQGQEGSQYSTLDEVRPDGTLDFSLRTEGFVYRSFRMRDLYTAPAYLRP